MSKEKDGEDNCVYVYKGVLGKSFRGYQHETNTKKRGLGGQEKGDLEQRKGGKKKQNYRETPTFMVSRSRGLGGTYKDTKWPKDWIQGIITITTTIIIIEKEQKRAKRIIIRTTEARRSKERTRTGERIGGFKQPLRPSGCPMLDEIDGK